MSNDAYRDRFVMFEGILPGGVAGFICCIVNLQDFKSKRQAEDEMSGPASLFAVMAREAPLPVEEGEVVVTCPNCLSENTEDVSKDHHPLFYCKDCETFFDRPE